MSICDWPEQERPRERLIQRGPQVLTDAELLAVFLRVGTPGKSAVDLARDLVGHFGSLAKVFSASMQEFIKVPGLGPAKFAQLQAVFELSRRALGENLRVGVGMDSPGLVRHYLRLQLTGRPIESFVVMFLDAQHRLIASEELFHGTLTHTSVYPREVVKRTLSHNAAAVILAHNHPSGNTTPSKADESLTHVLAQALSLIDVRLLDHFIIGDGEPYSFAEHGLI